MSRARGKSEQGGGKLRMLVTLAIFGAMIFVAIKIVPPYFANYQLQDKMQEVATFASVSRKTDDQIRSDVEKNVKRLGIPVHSREIQVTSYDGNVKIWIDYSVPVDLVIYQLQMHFHPQANNSSI